jgi:hypothetical protein
MGDIVDALMRVAKRQVIEYGKSQQNPMGRTVSCCG